MPRSLVLDGEIVCLDQDGRCQFNDLLFRRGDPCFVAFDLLQINKRDLRRERLIDRKHELKRITGGLLPIVYAEHIERTGVALFKKACELDLEVSSLKTGGRPTILSEVRGLRSGIETIRSLLDAKSCSNGNGMPCLFLDGTRVLWRLRDLINVRRAAELSLAFLDVPARFRITGLSSEIH
jgi:hypothetical protein